MFQVPVWVATDCGSEHQTDTQGRASMNVGSAKCQDLCQTPQDRTQMTHPVQGWRLITLTQPGIESRPAGCKAGILPPTPE